MSVRTDVVNLNVNVNGNRAQAELNNLRKRAAEIKFEMDGLKKGTQEYINKKAELKQVTDQMANLKKEIGLTSLTQKELIRELNTLKSLRSSVTPFTEEYKKLSQQIKEVENRLYDVKNGVQGFSSFFSKIKDEVKQFGAIAAGYLGFQFITSQFQSIIQGAGKLSDSLADIRRVTGMSATEVQHLNQQFKELDTRTPTEGLRNIAIIAGKLGIAKEDVFAFTAAVDKLVVALGDELGDAGQITDQLGKILNVFDKQGKVTSDNLLKAGNALVDLANKGVASGGFIVDFTQRLAGLAKTANLSLAASFGLGAGLEELGQKSESSSTAVIKVLAAIGSDVPKYAKIAGKSVEEFTKILRESPEEALIQVSEALTKNKKGFDEISQAFAAAGEDGAKVVTTMSVIGGKAEFMRGKIKDAGTALQETGEIQDAFALKNETFGATLDKLGKEINSVVSSSALTNFLKSAVNGLVDFIRFLKDLPRWVNENRTVLIALTGAILTYIAAKSRATQASILNRVATLLEMAADKLEAAQKWATTAATTAYSTAKDLLTGKVKLATVAQRIYNTVLAANPLAAFVAIATVAATVFSAVASALTKLTAAQRLQIEIQERVSNATVEETTKINILTGVVKDHNLSLDNRKKALEQLIAINPQYLNGLTLENIETDKGRQIINNYIKSLNDKAEAEAKYSLLVEKLKQRNEAHSELSKVEKKLPTSVPGMIGGAIMDIAGTGIYSQFDDAKNKIADLNDEIKLLQNDVSNNTKKNIEAAIGGTDTVVAISSKTTLEMLKKQLADLEKAYEQIDITDKKALAKNAAQRKILQAQIDELEGKTSARKEKKDNSEYERLLKEAQEFQKKLQEIKDKAAIKGESPEQREIDEVTLKYKELLAKATEYYKKHAISSKAFAADEVLIEKAKLDEIDAIYKKYFQQHVKDAQRMYELEQGGKYTRELLDAKKFYEEEKQYELDNYASGAIDKYEYENRLAGIESSFTDKRIKIANKYAFTVKQAGDDVVDATKDQQKQITEELIKQGAAREKLAEAEKNALLKIELAKAKNPVTGGPAAVKKATIDQATSDRDKTIDKLKRDLADAGIAATDEILQQNPIWQDAWQQFNDSVEQANKDFWNSEIDKVMGYVSMFQTAMTSLNQFITNRENKLLADEKKRNDEKKKSLKKQFDDKLLSQAQYDLKTQKLDEEQDKKEKQIQRDQAKREKALNLFSAVVSGAAAIAKAATSAPFPLNLPSIIAQTVLSGLQVAAVANTPLPELGTGDWLRTGPKHKDKEKGTHVLIERDEAVMSAAAMTDDNTYTVTGTTAQITSALNSKNGGANWANGAVIQMAQWRREKPASINPSLPRIMEQGGIVRPIDGVTNNNNSSEETNGLLRQLIVKQEENTQEIKTMKTKLHAVVSIKEYREEEAMYDAAKKASGVNQK